MTIMIKRIAAFLVVAMLAPGALLAYLPIGGRDPMGRFETFEWGRTPLYFIATRPAQGVTVADLTGAVQAAFSTWSGPTGFTATYGGTTSAVPDSADGLNVIGFSDLSNLPGFENTLGYTDFLFVDNSNKFIESDIVFNTAFPWSTSASGQRGRFDLQSIATHEIGHFLGLDHSAVGLVRKDSDGLTVVGKNSVMFPIAFRSGNVTDRALTPDDVAGMSEVYGTAGAGDGGIAGRVVKNGQGVFGAQVLAFNVATGALVSAFSLNTSGAYSMSRLAPGAYILRVEPLEVLETDSFFSDSTPVEKNFRVTYATRPVIVKAGSATSGIDVTVTAK